MRKDIACNPGWEWFTAYTEYDDGHQRLKREEGNSAAGLVSRIVGHYYNHECHMEKTRKVHQKDFVDYDTKANFKKSFLEGVKVVDSVGGLVAIGVIGGAVMTALEEFEIIHPIGRKRKMAEYDWKKCWKESFYEAGRAVGAVFCCGFVGVLDVLERVGVVRDEDYESNYPESEWPTEYPTHYRACVPKTRKIKSIKNEGVSWDKVRALDRSIARMEIPTKEEWKLEREIIRWFKKRGIKEEDIGNNIGAV